MIELRFAALEYVPGGAVSHFPDGSSLPARPSGEPGDHALAHRLGYEGDVLRCCRERQLAHHLVAEHFGMHSLALWPLAHGEQPMPAIAAAEEALAMALQRYARANEHPLVERVDWALLRARFLALADMAADA